MTFVHMTRRVLCALAFIGLAQTAIAQDAPRVKFVTNAGEFVVEVYPDKAPKTVDNFLQYVRDKHYDGTIFHRVIDGFMIQGGGFTADMTQKPTKAAIMLESGNGLKNQPYTIAMARTGNPHSATAQFFINVKNNEMLNARQPGNDGYAVFGKVIDGTAVVDKIKAVPTANKGFHQDVPSTPVTITSATLLP